MALQLRQITLLFVMLFSLVLCRHVNALTLPLPDQDAVIGSVKEGISKGSETLANIGRRYDVGAHEMKVANPSINPRKKLFAGTKVVIPSQFILPDLPRTGIVINLAELRLYYYPTDREVVVTQPIGIGKEGQWQTPIGKTKITKKEEDPFWHPTENVRAEALKHGTPIPSVFPPGPDNPLGKYILRLGWPTYLIHGTNRPDGVGARVSAGCIRMLPEDAKYLYDNVPLGTVVTVINQPYKSGWKGNQLYFEAHPPLEEKRADYAIDKSSVISIVQEQIDTQHAMVRWQDVNKLVRQYNGIPSVIGGK